MIDRPLALSRNGGHDRSGRSFRRALPSLSGIPLPSAARRAAGVDRPSGGRHFFPDACRSGRRGPKVPWAGTGSTLGQLLYEPLVRDVRFADGCRTPASFVRASASSSPTWRGRLSASLPSTTTAAPASSTSKKARARSSGAACRAAPSLPTRSASSSTRWLIISATSCGGWRCRRPRSRGR
jgi:hypothetical protein